MSNKILMIICNKMHILLLNISNKYKFKKNIESSSMSIVKSKPIERWARKATGLMLKYDDGRVADSHRYKNKV